MSQGREEKSGSTTSGKSPQRVKSTRHQVTHKALERIGTRSSTHSRSNSTQNDNDNDNSNDDNSKLALNQQPTPSDRNRPSQQDNILNPTPLARLLTYHLREAPDSIGCAGYTRIILGNMTAILIIPTILNSTLEWTNHNISNAMPFLIAGITSGYASMLYITWAVTKSFSDTLPFSVAARLGIAPQNQRLNKWLKIGSISLLSLSATLLPLLFSSEPVSKWLLFLPMSAINYYALNYVIVEHGRVMIKSLACDRKSKDYYTLLGAFKDCINQLAYAINRSKTIPVQLTQDSDLTQVDTLLRFFANQASELNIEPSHLLSTRQIIARRIIPGLTGATLGIAGSMGYLTHHYDSFNPNMNITSTNAILATAITSFPSVYLSAFFSAKMLIEITDVMACHGRKPLAMQLYPRVCLATMVFSALISSLFFVVAINQIDHNHCFQEDQVFGDSKATFKVLAGLASVAVSICVNEQLSLRLIESYARLKGDPNKQKLARFGIEIQSFLENTENKLTPKQFGESLSALNFNQQAAILPLSSILANREEMLAEITDRPVETQETSYLSTISSRSRGYLKAAYDHVVGNDDEIEKLQALTLNEQVEKGRNLQSPNPNDATGQSGTPFWRRLFPQTPAWPNFHSTRNQNEEAIVTAQPPARQV